MSGGQVDTSLFIGFGFYLIVLLICGLLAARLMKKLDDFLLAGRRLGPLSAAISERASGESAWFLLGLPGAAYGLGFTEFWSVIGIAFGIFFSWAFIALPLRRETERLGALTIPDYFQIRYQHIAPRRAQFMRVLSTVIIILFYTGYVAAQFVGGGKILNVTFGMDPVWGLIIGATVVMLYTMLGGFLAVVWTDVVQGLMMAAVAVVLPIVGIFELGGPSALIDKVAHLGPVFMSMNAATSAGGLVTETGAAFFFGVMLGSLSWGFGYLGQPHLLSRYMAIQRPKDVRTGMIIAMVWVLVAYWGAVFVGIVAAARIPGVADAETVMPLLALDLMPGWLAGLMIAGAVAAMMSTADSQLIVVTSALVEDVYVKMFRPRTSPGQLVVMSRLVTAGVCAVALAFALASPRDPESGNFLESGVIFNMVAYAWAGLGSSFGPPLLLSLRWKRTTAAGVLAGMLSGTISNIIWKNTAALGELLDLKLATFLISLAFTIIVSLITSSRDELSSERTRS